MEEQNVYVNNGMSMKKEKNLFVLNLQYYQFDQDSLKNRISFMRDKLNVNLQSKIQKILLLSKLAAILNDVK